MKRNYLMTDDEAKMVVQFTAEQGVKQGRLAALREVREMVLDDMRDSVTMSDVNDAKYWVGRIDAMIAKEDGEK